MSIRSLRAAALAAALACAPAASPDAALLGSRPGPVERPVYVASGDFNRDGCQDLAIANFEAGSVSILVNGKDPGTHDCTGSFEPFALSPVPVGLATTITTTSGPIQILVRDLNREDADSDGVPNVRDDCPNVYDPVDSITGKQVDLNINGIGDTCEKLLCSNDPTKVCTMDSECASGGTCDTVDSDGDGIPDYDPVMKKLDNCPFIYNPGQGDMETCVTDPGDAALKGPDGVCGTPDDLVGDHVGDACADSPDLVILVSSVGFGSSFGAVRIRLNDGAGGMLSRASKGTLNTPDEVVLANFDGDLRPDLVVSNTLSNMLQFLPGQADGAFGTQKLIATGKGPQGLAAGDFNGDGRIDLAVANREERTVGIYLNSASGLPAAASATLTTEAQPTKLLSGRLNGDLFDDLLVLDQGGSTCVGGPLPGKSCDSDADCADAKNPANNGTCPPVVPVSGVIQEFTGSSGGTLSPNPAATISLGPGQRPLGAVLKDLDGNGPLDLAVADFSGANVLVFSGAGDGTFAPAATLGGVDAPASLAALDINPQDPSGPSPDLAVLDFAKNRVDLFRNDGGLAFSTAPTSPASPWKESSAIALFAADASTGADIVLPQRTSRRLEVLSGIGNGFFRALPTLTLKGPSTLDGMVQADFRDDGLTDVALLDRTGSKVTVVTSEPSGVLVERRTADLANPPARGAAGSLVTILDDYDRDGVPNIFDNCPTRYNPPLCKVTDPACAVDVQCTDSKLASTKCDAGDPSMLDPLTMQCDSDHNGIGDQCQLLNPACLALDTDQDFKFDYDPTALGTTADLLDFDRDGIPNHDPMTGQRDNCPTIANPGQIDTNVNRIGDACEKLACSNDATKSCTQDSGCVSPGTCTGTVDTDGDGKLDYDPAAINLSLSLADQIAAALDNCPSIFNPSICQTTGAGACGMGGVNKCSSGGTCATDADCLRTRCTAAAQCGAGALCVQPDNDGDGVGNACIHAAALDDCPFRFDSTQIDTDGDGVGDACEFAVQDLATVSPAAGTVNLMTGDGSGSLREAVFSPIGGLANPSAVLIGGFSLRCLAGTICNSRTEQDLVVAEQVVTGNPADDRLDVFLGDGAGGFSPAPTVGVQGDPIALLLARDQPVCPVPPYPGQPDSRVRFDQDVLSTVVAVVEPGTSTLEVLLASNQDQIFPGTSPLVRPPAHTAPLPVPGTLVDATFADMNNDGVMDLVALSTGNFGTSTPNVTIYLGLRNGLFFTDPTFNPLDVPDGGTLVGTANTHVQSEGFLPDVVVFNQVDTAPWVLTNLLKERADIDGSGRVDGFDLAIFARAFGARRGEDFTIQADGTLQQSGTGYSAVVVGTGSEMPGQDLPDSGLVCSRKLEAVDATYGLPVDINLDGIVDGMDLALLASRFGSKLGP